MKTLRNNLLLLAFAVGALILIGGNVWGSGPGSDPNESEEPGEGGGMTSIKICYPKVAPAFWVVRTCAGYNPNFFSSYQCGALLFFARPDSFGEQCF